MTQDRPKQVTPVGTAVWPNLIEPDMKFAKNGIGSFYTRLRLSAENAQPLMDLARELQQQAYDLELAKLEKEAVGLKGAKATRVKARIADLQMTDLPFRPALDEDTGEETGEVEVNFKSNAGFISKRTGETIDRRVLVFDAAGRPIQVNVGGGSKIQVSFTPGHFYMPKKGAGATFRLEAVRVLELIERAPQNAEGFGFEVEPDEVAEAAGDFVS